jgi:hypothetical protein
MTHHAWRRLEFRTGSSGRHLRAAGRGAALAAFIVWAHILPAEAQTPDCLETGPAASVVCRDPTLTGLADELNRWVRELVSLAAREARRALVREQRDWSLGLNDCLDSADPGACLAGAYETRISELEAGLPNGAVFAEPGAGGDEIVESTPLEPLEPAGEGEDTPGASSGEPEAAPADQDADSQADAEVALGAFRGEPPQSGARSLEGTALDGILTTTVWKADIATGIRPGTIFIFTETGALVTADCVESYRLGSWSLSDDDKLVLDDGSGHKRSARIVSARDNFLRLQIDASDERGGTLVLRPAIAPFSCKSG